MKKRKLDIAVISDVHLGTYDCHAEELLVYLNSIQPKKLVLNGNIITLRQTTKPYFPTSHTNVLRKIMGMATKGTEVFYIAGNPDREFRRLSDLSIGNLHVLDKLILDIDGRKAWFFHGEVLDFSVRKAKWLTKLGSWGYGLGIMMHGCTNRILTWQDKENPSFSKKVVRNDRYVNDFEQAAVNVAIDNGYDIAVCGQVHRPKKEIRANGKGHCTYLNSGDWVESLTALEYSLKRWKVYRYSHDKLSPFFADEEMKEMDIHELIASITAKKAKKL